MQLRSYQQAAIDALWHYWKYRGKAPLVVAPTGSGKSLLIAEICRKVLTDHPGTRIIQVTDSKELIEQNCKEFLKYYPEASTGIYSAGLGKKQRHADVTFAGIQSVYKHVYDFDPAIDLVIIDECHMIPKESDTRYGEFLKAVRIANPSAAFVGLTATPFRLDSGMLHQGEGALFDGIAYDININTLIKEGYLVPVISKGGVKNIDLSQVKTTSGEYNLGDLACAADDPALVEAACEEIKRYGADRKSWLIFAAGVDHAYHIQSLIPGSEVVIGEMNQKARDTIINQFRDGKIKCLINVNVLTKGFNAPCVDLIALMTATKSTSKYVQMCGRGTRTCQGKENCLLLDYGFNVQEHGPIDAVNPKTKGTGQAPMKQCPSCQALLYASARECTQCGYAYPEQETLPNHGTQAFDGAVLTDQIEPFWVNVQAVEYSRHTKEGKPDSMKISYITKGGERYNTWLAVDHGGFAAEQALRWLAKIGSDATSVSEALEEALSGRWPMPRRIQCKQDGKWCRVVNEDYSRVKQECLNYE